MARYEHLAIYKHLEYQASPTFDYSGKTMPQVPGHTTAAALGYQPVAGHAAQFARPVHDC